MNHKAHPNSIESYKELVESGDLTKGQVKVVRVFNGDTRLTREQIAKVAGLKESSVCGRVNELIKADVLQEVGDTKSSAGKKAAVIALHSRYRGGLNHQTELFNGA